jgi:hypothetical protein
MAQMDFVEVVAKIFIGHVEDAVITLISGGQESALLS